MPSEGPAPVTTPASDDSVSFLKRSALVDAAGLPFSEFRKRLTPRYSIVWTHIALGYAALVAIGAGVVLTAGLWPGWLRVAIAAALYGLAHAFLQLFFHEAAHFNVAPTRALNDRLANATIGAMYGLDIAAYRLVHFEHHRRLGTAKDTERSYFDPLNMRLIAEALLGIRVLRVLSRRQALITTATTKEPAAPLQRAVRRQRVLALSIHLIVLVGSVGTGHVALAMAWALGTFSVMPLLASLRQLLEHRSETADPRIDYSSVDHGAVNRLFGSGPVASTFGGAGFNRHLLHHWEPQISYTRLHELEEFLLRTQAAPEIRARQSSYWRTFWNLVSW